jgi:hypothetical protein
VNFVIASATYRKDLDELVILEQAIDQSVLGPTNAHRTTASEFTHEWLARRRLPLKLAKRLLELRPRDEFQFPLFHDLSPNDDARHEVGGEGLVAEKLVCGDGLAGGIQALDDSGMEIFVALDQQRLDLGRQRRTCEGVAIRTRRARAVQMQVVRIVGRVENDSVQRPRVSSSGHTRSVVPG